MGCRDNKLKYNCGSSKQNARCTFYEGDLPEFSKLEDCVTIEETTEEIYEKVQEIKDSLDLSDLGKDCLDYSEFQQGKELQINEVLMTFENEICDLKEKKPDGSTSVDISKLDLDCLVDPCNNIIDTQQKLIQLLINEICDLKAQIQLG